MTEVLERTYTFNELSESAKQKVRDARHEQLDYTWWDSCFDDFVLVATCLGVEIDNSATMNQAKYELNTDANSIAIFFSGFSSQGAGASFTGIYNLDEIGSRQEAVTAHAPEDKTLHGIAARLDAITAEFRLKYPVDPNMFSRWIKITKSPSNYSHENTMHINIDDLYERFVDPMDDEPVDGDPNTTNYLSGLGDGVLEVMKDLARWMYSSLEKEYDYLLSDECIIERGLTYNEEGEEQ